MQLLCKVTDGQCILPYFDKKSIGTLCSLGKPGEFCKGAVKVTVLSDYMFVQVIISASLHLSYSIIFQSIKKPSDLICILKIGFLEVVVEQIFMTLLSLGFLKEKIVKIQKLVIYKRKNFECNILFERRVYHVLFSKCPYVNLPKHLSKSQLLN